MPEERVGAVFSALADPTRRSVMQRVAERGSATATELAAELPITRQAVAKHLGALEDAGLVAASRLGRETRFTLTPAPLADVVAWLADVGAAWDRRLAGLERHLGERGRRR